MKSVYFWIFLLSIVVITGCSKEDSTDELPPDPGNPGYTGGVFVINEGPFQTGTGTITHISRIDGEVILKLYQQENGGNVLGNVVQSMNYNPLISPNAFICVNNANKIEVVDMKTFKRVQALPDITSPRYVEFGENNKIYVSCWDNTVKIFTLDDTEYFGQVSTGEGPEKLMKVGNAIWVLNQGGFSVDSTITVISTETDQVVQTLEVYPKPTGIQFDQEGHVWVLCSGKGWNGFPAPDDSEGHLLCIDPDDYTILKDLPFPDKERHPEKLVIDENGSYLFYNQEDGIYRHDIHAPEIDDEPFIHRGTMFYGLGLDIETGLLYASDPLDYVQQGFVYRYNASTGVPVDSLLAGIIPGEFFFSRLAAGK